MSVLTWDVRSRAGHHECVIKGAITEVVDFSALFEPTADSGVLDLEGVTSINSSGARELMRFLRRVQDAGHRLTLRRCSPAFVSQLNMIFAFAGNARIESVMAPFVCDDCDETATRLVDLAEDPEVQIVDGPPCPECGAQMVFDDIVEHFFGFLQE